MNVSRDSALIAALFLAGMGLPFAVAISFHDVLSLYLTGSQFTAVLAVTFGLLTWVFLIRVDPDRVDFLSASLVFPWIFVTGVVFAVLVVGRHDGLGYLVRSFGDLATFGASYMVAAIAAVVFHRRAERIAEETDWAPPPRSIAMTVSIVLALVVAAGGGFLHVTATSTSISDVEPGVADYAVPVLNVTLEGEPTELRLEVTAPNGDAYTKRVSRSTVEDGPITVPVQFYRFHTYPLAGTYQVEVSAITGMTVDTATYTVENAPSPSIQSVETAGPGEDLDLELAPNSTVYRPSPGLSDSETRVGVVIENEGDVADRFETRLLVEEDRVIGRSIFIEPGQQGGNILAIPDEDVERIVEEWNGTIAVEVRYSDERLTEEVELPISNGTVRSVVDR